VKILENKLMEKEGKIQDYFNLVLTCSSLKGPDYMHFWQAESAHDPHPRQIESMQYKILHFLQIESLKTP